MTATVGAGGLLILAAGMPGHDVGPVLGVLAAWLACSGAGFAWILHAQRYRRVLLDARRRRLIVEYRSRGKLLRACSLPLDRFVSVISYYPIRNYPPNLVVLVERDPNFALLLEAHAAATLARSFWSLPATVEARGARAARERIAKVIGLPDGGYRKFYPAFASSEEKN